MMKNMFIRKVLSKNVQDKTYLFGGSGVLMALDNNVVLMLRVDEQGEPINIFTNKLADGTAEFNVGTLNAGEFFVIPLNQLVNVYATADHDSSVEITLIGAA